MLLPTLPRTCSCMPQSTGLLSNLAKLSLGENDIDLVVLTQLHAWPSAQLYGSWRRAPYCVYCSRACYLVSAAHWRRALCPPPDRGRFIPWILRQLEHGSRMGMVEDGFNETLGNDWHLSDGYTCGQLLPEINLPGGPLLFAGDCCRPATGSTRALSAPLTVIRNA